MTAPSAVIFDYGNVLSLDQPRNAIEEMAGLCRTDVASFEKHYWHFRLAYDRGDFDGTGYWLRVADRCTTELAPGDVQKLIDADNRSWSHENQEIVRLAKALKASGIKLAILSNMPVDFRKFHPSGCPWLPQFDHHTFSCELRSVKPDPQIYEHCLKGLKVEAKQALFIDDRLVNIEAGEKLGIKGLHFTSTATVVEQLKSLFNPLELTI